MMLGARHWFAWRPVFLSVWAPSQESSYNGWRRTWRLAWFRRVTRWNGWFTGTHYEDA